MNYYVTNRKVIPQQLLGFSKLNFEHSAHFESADIIFVDALDEHSALGFISRIRSNDDVSIYLLPIVFLYDEKQSPFEKISPADAHLYYSELSEFEVNRVATSLSSISDNIKELSEYSEAERNLPTKLLRYLYSRQKPLSPVKTTSSLYGYRYPALEPFGNLATNAIANTLNKLAALNYLFAQSEEKAYHCNSCGCAFLNFRELCPDCDSNKLEVHELIHHFYCANIDKKSAYLGNNGELTCPKCEKDLLHLGSDYDKPSVMYQCLDCEHTFQDSIVAAECYHCGNKSKIDLLKSKDISTFHLTSLSKQGALFGLEDMLSSAAKKVLHSLELSVFKHLVFAEIARIKRYKISQSILVRIHIGNFDQLLNEIGNRSKEFFEELMLKIRTYLRTCDLITTVNETTMAVLLVETPEQNAELVLTRITEKLDKFITEFISTPLDINTEICAINKHFTSDERVKTLLS